MFAAAEKGFPMHKIASQEIDFHDRAAFLNALSQEGELPEYVKQAAAVERGSIPLEKFALVVVTDHGTFPKYALHSKAYTWINSRLFNKTAAKLPERCIQIAAFHIKQACEAWGVDCPDYVLAKSDPVDEVVTNVFNMDKAAAEECCNSLLDYNKYRIGFRGEPSKELLKQKMQEFMTYDSAHPSEAQQVGEELASRLYAWAMDEGYSLPSPGSLAGMASSCCPKEVADKGQVKGFFLDKLERISSEEKTKRASKDVKTAATAMGMLGIGEHFPMQSSELVKRAEEYFHDNYELLAPKNRRELATNIVKNASGFGMFVENELIRKYAGQLLSRAIEGNVMARKAILKEASHENVLSQLYARRNVMDPEAFACALEEFDKQAGISTSWGKDIKDPYLSTFEVTKVAQWSYRDGQDVINEQQLHDFVNKHIDMLHGYVNDHIIRDLKSMPVEIFDSLPRPEKEIIISKMEEAGVA